MVTAQNFLYYNKATGQGRLPRWLGGNESACECRRHGFDPWIGKIPWRRKWQPTPVFLPEKLCGRRSLAGYSPCIAKNRTRLSNWACAQQHLRLGHFLWPASNGASPQVSLWTITPLPTVWKAASGVKDWWWRLMPQPVSWQKDYFPQGDCQDTVSVPPLSF